MAKIKIQADVDRFLNTAAILENNARIAFTKNLQGAANPGVASAVASGAASAVTPAVGNGATGVAAQAAPAVGNVQALAGTGATPAAVSGNGSGAVLSDMQAAQKSDARRFPAVSTPAAPANPAIVGALNTDAQRAESMRLRAAQANGNGQAAVGNGTVTQATGAAVSGVANGTAQPTYDFTAGMMDEGTYRKTYLNDPDTVYEESKAALDRELMQSFATYGERAERLYQMGMSGAGVSDIYGGQAYAQYINNVTALKVAQIKAKEENKQKYLQYVDAYKNEGQARINTAASELITNGGYNGQNTESLRAALIGQGMSAEEAGLTLDRAKAVFDAQRQEASNGDGTGAAATSEREKTAYNAYADSYTGDTAQDNTIRTDMTVNGYTGDEIDRVIELLRERNGGNGTAAANPQTVATARSAMVTADADTGVSTLHSMEEVRNAVKDDGAVEAARTEAVGELGAQVKTWAANFKDGIANAGTVDDLFTTLNAYKNKGYFGADGENSKEYQAILADAQNACADVYVDAFDHTDGAYALCGKTAEEWGEMDENKQNELLNVIAGEAYKAGKLNSAGIYRYYSGHIDANMEAAAESNDTLRATASIYMYMKSLCNKGYVSDKILARMKDDITDKLNMKVEYSNKSSRHNYAPMLIVNMNVNGDTKKKQELMLSYDYINDNEVPESAEKVSGEGDAEHYFVDKETGTIYYKKGGETRVIQGINNIVSRSGEQSDVIWDLVRGVLMQS